jgi:hypothetical protein
MFREEAAAGGADFSALRIKQLGSYVLEAGRAFETRCSSHRGAG